MTIKKKVTSKADPSEKVRYLTDRDRRHLDAIPILIEFARKMRQVPIEEVSRAAGKALREWDKARG